MARKTISRYEELKARVEALTADLDARDVKKTLDRDSEDLLREIEEKLSKFLDEVRFEECEYEDESERHTAVAPKNDEEVADQPAVAKQIDTLDQAQQIFQGIEATAKLLSLQVNLGDLDTDLVAVCMTIAREALRGADLIGDAEVPSAKGGAA